MKTLVAIIVGAILLVALSLVFLGDPPARTPAPHTQLPPPEYHPGDKFSLPLEIVCGEKESDLMATWNSRQRGDEGALERRGVLDGRLLLISAGTRLWLQEFDKTHSERALFLWGVNSRAIAHVEILSGAH